MLVGHYSAAFLAKGVEPRLPLWVLLLAAQLVDIVHVLLVLGGLERVGLDPSLASNPLDLQFIPFTHGLAAALIWSAAVFLVARVRWFPDVRRSGVLALVVASHWVLDLVVHRPDLPLLTGDPRLGLSLWNHPWLSLLLEEALLIASAVFCLRRWGHGGAAPRRLMALCIGLAVLQIVTLALPAPASALALLAPLLALFVAVAWLGHRAESAADAKAA